MTRPFSKALPPLLLLLAMVGAAVAAPAQQMGDDLFSALQEARAAGVSETTLNQLLALAYEKQVEPSGMASLLPILAQCKRENLPLEPFLSKIEEGLSKRIPAARIAQVLAARLQDYRFTRSLIDQTARIQGKVEPGLAESQIRLTETLYCGLSRENLTHLLASFPSAPLLELSRGAETLASLKQLRFDPQLTERIVETAMRQGYFAVEQRDFARIVAAAKKKGLSDEQIAAAALEVMKNRGSENEFSSRLGISDQDQSRHGPQMQKNSSPPGSPARKESSLSPPRNRDGHAGKGRGATSNSRTSGLGSGAGPTSETIAVSDPADGSGDTQTSDGTTRSGTGGRSENGPGSSVVKNTSPTKVLDAAHALASLRAPDADKSTRAAADARGDKNSKTAGTFDPPRPSDPANSSDAAKDSKPASGSVPDKNSTTGKVSDPSDTAKTGPSPGSTGGSHAKPGAGGGDSWVPGPGASDENSSGANGNSGSGSSDPAQDEANLTFAAAGTLAAIDLEALTLALAVEEADQLLTWEIGDVAHFDISERVAVSAKGTDLGTFVLGLDDLILQGDALRVSGEQLADGTLLLTQIVLPLDTGEGSGSETPEAPDEAAPEGSTFAAAGIVVAFDPESLTLTLALDKASHGLGEHLGSEAHFDLSPEVKVATEASSVGALVLGHGDIAVQADYVRVLGRNSAHGDRLITHMVLYLKE